MLIVTLVLLFLFLVVVRSSWAQHVREICFVFRCGCRFAFFHVENSIFGCQCSSFTLFFVGMSTSVANSFNENTTKTKKKSVEQVNQCNYFHSFCRYVAASHNLFSARLIWRCLYSCKLLNANRIMKNDKITRTSFYFSTTHERINFYSLCCQTKVWCV